MKYRNKLLSTAILAASLCSGSALAAVSEEEAAHLGNELTPMGAEKAGNGDEIPAWDGGLTTAPDGYAGDHRYIDPFQDDSELFRIDQSNVDEYEDKLTPGQVRMIETYDDYFIPVYETRRTAAVPESIMDQTQENATTVELVESGNGLKNYDKATPFPIPQNALEIIFNHTTRYRGGALKRNVVQVTPQANGAFSEVQFEEEIVRPWELSDYSAGSDAHDNILFYFKQTIKAPSRLSGNTLLVHETINQVEEPRRAWLYNSGQRRVRRAPQVAYDGPGTAADGQRTSDNLDLYNGAPDKYDWEIVGKKEKYIPYNSYQFASQDLSYDDIIKAGHVNQEHARYELHRVWHIRATLKDGERHIYETRDFYIDEDSWQIAVVDHYDGRGELWRVAESHMLQAYDEKIPFYAFETLYDTRSGRYLVMGMTNEESKPYSFGINRRSREFTPSALRR
jgi:hypothetical protein